MNITKSRFVRSVMARVLAVFIVVSIVIVAVAFYSFTNEIRKGMLSDKQKQLATVEKTISSRMEEVASIAYNISTDSVFYMEPVKDLPAAGNEMSEMLKRYIVGNSFIEHLAYCRVSEPDTIYVSSGTRSLSSFLTNAFGMEASKAEELVLYLQQETRNSMTMYGEGDNAYFAYVYPLPQLAVKPKAHVLVMIPAAKVRPLLSTLLVNGMGEMSVFDGEGAPIYRDGSLPDELPLTEYAADGAPEREYTASSGRKYVMQKVVSASNGWTYISVLRHEDTLPGLASQQQAFIIFVLLLLGIVVIVLFASIVVQYKPISNLAAQVADGGRGGVVDERALLKDTIATLSEDSAEKRKFQTAYYEAEAANKAKTAFLSSMSHDIRTPMNAIIGMTAIAQKHIGDQAYVAECLQKVRLASDYLLDIINNVLDMSRIEAGRIPIAEEPIFLPALIDSVVSLMASSVKAKSQTLEVRADGLRQTAVLGDNVHLVQVFVNILSNAVKFTPEGGKLTFTASQTSCDDPERSNYVFTFSDTGIGIPPEFVAHVFDTFARADGPTASRTEGTGLGMAIAKKLVELMGGAIRCESELGHGTTFTVTMPMKLTDEKEAMERTTSSGYGRTGGSAVQDTPVNLTGKRILLVEDNALNREIARKIICETGAEIIETQNGKEAVDTFARQPEGYFDLIFMDIQMPVMDGYEATAAIRSMNRADAATVPIYAMTANTFDEDVRHVKDAGMNGHIGKPYNPALVYKLLSHALVPHS